MTRKFYWQGNIAKTRIIDDILQTTSACPNKNFLIFDYGCGRAGDWPQILNDNPNLQLIGYDPCKESIMTAKARLNGCNAELLSGKELESKTFLADYIVSFSVLEHVFDRHYYLRTAKRLLAERGIFYLNYDDGHFRNLIDLNRPHFWLNQFKEWLKNLRALIFSKFGKDYGFQSRVIRSEIDQQINSIGFKVANSYFCNLVDFKELFKTIPEKGTANFTEFWLNVENSLNSSFLFETENVSYGDKANLWKIMSSRTLVLNHQT